VSSGNGAVVQEVLQVWRDAARVADELPDDDAVRHVLLFEVAELRGLYHRLTAGAGMTDAVVRASRNTIDDTKSALDIARSRIPSGGHTAHGLIDLPTGEA
jgi:hypothetical protein